MVRVQNIQRIIVILLVSLCTLTLCWGQVTVVSDPDLSPHPAVEEGQPHFDLVFQESGGSVNGSLVFDDDLSLVKVPANKDTNGKTSPDNAIVLRGYLRTNPKPEACMAFLWEVDQEKLTLDLNLNRDLTDDPNGIYTNQETGSSRKRYQRFKNIHITVPHQGLHYPYHLSINLNRYNARNKYGYVTVLSGYHSQITLNDQPWEITLCENLDGLLNGHDQIKLRPIDANNTGYTAQFNLPEYLFLQEQSYACDCELVMDDNQPKIALALTPENLPLGQLHLTGQKLRFLLFQSDKVAVPVFHPEQSPHSIPAGIYRCPQLELIVQNNQLRLQRNSNQEQFTVLADRPATFEAGAPLKPVITATRAGQSVKLDFTLQGQGGETYTTNSHQHKPRFTVYKGKTKVDSGEFEYG